MIIQLKNDAGFVKQAKIGFSWTTFFFSVFPALFRGDLKWFVIQFLFAFITFGFSWIVFAFIYNGIYVRELLTQGFKPVSESDRTNLVRSGFIIPELSE